MRYQQKYLSGAERLIYSLFIINVYVNTIIYMSQQ